MDPAEGRKAASGSGGAGGRVEAEGLLCPRCQSTNTKFCYYNNYNLAQPRHFCKACRRYWTRGGSLRNVPIGGGTRKVHAAAASGRRRRGPQAAPAPATAPAPVSPPPPLPYPLGFATAIPAVDPDRRLLELGGSFSSLLAPASNGHYTAGFVGGGVSLGVGTAAAGPPQQPPMAQALPEGFWGIGWPDLSI